jgi:hypothetical protein
MTRVGHCERSEAIYSQVNGLLRRPEGKFAINVDSLAGLLAMTRVGHCERSEAIYSQINGLLRRPEKKFAIYVDSLAGLLAMTWLGCSYVSWLLFRHVVIASEAKQSILKSMDCFVGQRGDSPSMLIHRLPSSQ